MRRATQLVRYLVKSFCISIHALLAESDCTSSPPAPRRTAFLSTLSLRRATCNCVAHALGKIYFYPRSPCGERRVGPARGHWWGRFLSTLSLRRATPASMRGGPGLIYFYPRSPCGERPVQVRHQRHAGRISIHALLAESDSRRMPWQRVLSGFLSTLSLRRATGVVHVALHDFGRFLSTLSLRRATRTTRQSCARRGYFYPRSPCGERLPNSLAWVLARLFLSTLSLRRATGV